MRVKTIKDEDFINFKVPSMFIGTISCSGKCCIEAGIDIATCQNDFWRGARVIDIDDEQIVSRYLCNQFTSAIVFGGLEPFEQFEELYNLIKLFRERVNDTIVIYTGYKEEEVEKEIKQLAEIPNIIVKFGRFIPGQQSKFDETLGVKLASPNQYARYISNEFMTLQSNHP